jgi:hypothetical protein
MIDMLAIAITHVLLLVAFWRLRDRDDLDDERAPGQVHRGSGFAVQRDRD